MARRRNSVPLDVGRLLPRANLERIEKMERENAEINDWDWDELHDHCAIDMMRYDAMPKDKRDVVKEVDFSGLLGRKWG